MKIEGISIKGFKGISDMTHRFNNTVTVLSGPVGVGKTSFIQAIRFGLTGETPALPIKAGESEATVTLDCGEELCIERKIARPNRKTVSILGRKVGTGATEEFIADMTSVGKEIIKIVTSSEVLAGLKPSEFGNIFLDGSEEKRTRDELLTMFKEIKSKEKDVVMKSEAEGATELPADVVTEIKTLFPDKIVTLPMIEKACTDEKARRRDFSTLYKDATSRSKDFLSITKPEYTEKEIRAKLEEVIGVERNIKHYAEAAKVYNAAVEAKKKHDKHVVQLKLDISMLHAVAPDEKKEKALKEERTSTSDRVLNAIKVLQTLNDNKTRLSRTLEKLDQPFCPISEKLVCSTDKTDFKEDLELEIFETEKSIELMEAQSAIDKTRISEIDAELAEIARTRDTYNKRLILEKELKSLEASPVKLPEKPGSLPKKKDYSEEKAVLQEKLDMLRRYQDAASDFEESKRLKRKVEICDFIIKALEPKGPIIEAYLQSFKTVLETACNERAALLKTGFEVKFVLDEGILVYFKTKPGAEFLPFTSLSAGERIFAELILTDLINSFCNSRILILDDIDHLDEKSFRELLNFVTKEEMSELYDNIILSCVEHTDLLEAIPEYDVDFIHF